MNKTNLVSVNQKFEELKGKAVRLENGVEYGIEELTIFSYNGEFHKSLYKYEEDASDFFLHNVMAVKDNILVFSTNENAKYFLPFSSDLYSFLAGKVGLTFTDSSVFAYPLSYNNFPVDLALREKWIGLLSSQWDANQEKIASDCNSAIYENNLKIKPIDPTFLKTYCDKATFSGVDIGDAKFYPWIYVYSVSIHCVETNGDSTGRIPVKDLPFIIGKFDYDQKTVVFTDVTGTTYVTDNFPETIKILRSAGYTRTFMPIPLQRSEEWLETVDAFNNLSWLLDDSFKFIK